MLNKVTFLDIKHGLGRGKKKKQGETKDKKASCKIFLK